MRPASSSSAHSRSSAAPRARPQSAAVDIASGSPSQRPSASTFKPTKDKANTSSDELIRNLEAKVRKIVEQKRAESDKLRFAVAKKRDDVEKAKLLLQDLLKDSEALGLHFDLSESASQEQQPQVIPVKQDDDDPTRLQPIASISRRPVYSKHTNIHELEAKLGRRAKEAHVVHRRTLVLEHIKKRLLNERVEVAQITNQLKQIFADLSHETQELQKKEIAAAEAVSQEQTRLTQQKADMAESARKFKRELALRLKWAREKAKFEKYYNDQLQAATAKAAQTSAVPSYMHQLHHDTPMTAAVGMAPRTSVSPTSVLKSRRSTTFHERQQEEAIELMYRDAFQRIGVDAHVEAIDPEEIIRIFLSHEELKKELDAKYEESVERIAQLREQIDKARTLAREDIPLSKRGTSQKIETKQLEIAGVERQLATVVDQYMFVEQSVRPIKIGLQQILQNVSNATVNIDNMTALETSLVESCEEMARLLRAGAPPPLADASNQDGDTTSTGVTSIPEDGPVSDGAARKGSGGSPLRAQRQREGGGAKPSSENAAEPLGIVALENFTSPYNVRITAKSREQYFVAGLMRRSAHMNAEEEEEPEEHETFEVMDRAMVKRISSVVVCTSAGKKPGEKPAVEELHPSPPRHQTR